VNPVLPFGVVALLAASSMGCSKPESTEGTAPTPNTVTEPIAAPAATRTTPQPTTPPPRPKAKIPAFADASKALEKRCTPKLPPSAANIEVKAAANQTAECIKKTFTADLDLVLLPTKSVDPNRFNALMREQATWNKWTEDLCWLVEEAFWVDFDKGTRDDGTMRSLPWLGCKQQVASERDYYALALKADDAAALATRIEQLAKAGTRTKELLDKMEKDAAKLAEAPLVDAGASSFPRPLTPAERSNLLLRTKSIDGKVNELTHSTCGWAALAETLGGTVACEASASLYYLGHANLETNRGH
jgi:hypothetical protein